MIATEPPTWADQPAMPKSNYRASGLVLRFGQERSFERCSQRQSTAKSAFRVFIMRR